MNKYAGTKTEKNLETAFSGESQARNKYTYFASVAEKEGYADETMQIKSIELSRQGLEHTADMQQREITQKCRLSVGLGAMSGLLILLLLV